MSFIGHSRLAPRAIPLSAKTRPKPARKKKSASSGDAQYAAVTLEGLEPST